ncbi:MAG: hypothetical protein ACXIU7_05590 [Roseinatronobacter sp.]
MDHGKVGCGHVGCLAARQRILAQSIHRVAKCLGGRVLQRGERLLQPHLNLDQGGPVAGDGAKGIFNQILRREPALRLWQCLWAQTPSPTPMRVAVSA